MVPVDDIDGQSVNIIDPAAIKAEVAARSAPPVDSADGADGDHGQQTQPGHRRRRGQLRQHERLASEVSRALKKRGYTIGQVRDRNASEPSSTTIGYGAGAEGDARNLADLLGLDAPKPPDSTIQPGHIPSPWIPNNHAGRGRLTQRRDHHHHHDDNHDDQQVQTVRLRHHQHLPHPDQGKPIDGGGAVH